MTFELTPEEAKLIFDLLGEQPSSSGVFPIMVKMKEQADAQPELRLTFIPPKEPT